MRSTLTVEFGQLDRELRIDEFQQVDDIGGGDDRLFVILVDQKRSVRLDG